MEIYLIFSKSFPFNSFNFDFSMRMIDEKEIIEPRKVKNEIIRNEKSQKSSYSLRRFMSRILSNFLKKFPFRLFQFRPLDANDRREGNNRTK